ncbi:hypothetical protein COLO4_08284 [Corchorus olitorius]|uniref:Uncharacterized protein n=1 Tax=Corchorus olitorius TaxID=93759 RepID=A0A1R3KGF6_9ROSI|nr:hypothetical protein COLO4_08284 [Corchorus olitorius]
MVLHSAEAEDECYDWFFPAITGDLDRLKEMVSTRLNGGNLTNFLASYKGRYGQTVFHFAASAGSIQICQYLVEELNLNVDDFISDKGFTPLHSAIVGESFDVAFYLLDKGANPNAAENRGLTPLHMAATIGILVVLLCLGNFLHFFCLIALHSML